VILDVYSWLMWAIKPLLRSKLRRRGLKESGYLENIEERFGVYANTFKTTTSSEQSFRACIWVHAVSLGETRAAEVLLQALRSEYPHLRIVLTHGTATGRALGATLLRDGDVQVWQPWDTPSIVQRFLQHFQPHLAVVLETEVWPNWVAQCKRANIPLVLVNARMSEKSMLSAQRLAWLSGPAYAGLSGVWAQTPDDAKRLELLGAPVMEVVGNVKFDAQPNSVLLAQALLWSKNFTRPVVLLASSREGEEALWLDALQALKENLVYSQEHVHAVHWLVVPRHPQRFDEVAQAILNRGWKLSRRSEWVDGPSQIDEANVDTVWLGDSMGEMSLYFGLADVALLGGSFMPLGGQNLIEATACGCPVIMGPHTFNFAEAAELALEADAALRVEDMAQAVTSALQLVCSGPDENSYVSACLAFTQKNKGATQRTVQALKPYLMR
jgi:3-deoxy-D-manno-octulosonic-acid transferase